ncbi:hypothetical protein PYCC9005_001043 [Savitreella phatthalungensis]
MSDSVYAEVPGDEHIQGDETFTLESQAPESHIHDQGQSDHLQQESGQEHQATELTNNHELPVDQDGYVESDFAGAYAGMPADADYEQPPAHTQPQIIQHSGPKIVKRRAPKEPKQTTASIKINVCDICQTTDSKLWRRGAGDRLCCNACGLRYKRSVKSAARRAAGEGRQSKKRRTQAQQIGTQGTMVMTTPAITTTTQSTQIDDALPTPDMIQAGSEDILSMPQGHDLYAQHETEQQPPRRHRTPETPAQHDANLDPMLMLDSGQVAGPADVSTQPESQQEHLHEPFESPPVPVSLNKSNANGGAHDFDMSDLSEIKAYVEAEPQ